MFRIRVNQMTVLQEGMREKFVARMAGLVSVSADHTSEPIGDSRSFVEEAIDEAAQYEIVAEEDVARFISILQKLFSRDSINLGSYLPTWNHTN
jgi:hypothetical protein